MNAEAKVQQLEQELEIEKARLREATQKSIEAVKTDLSVQCLAQAYPLQTAILMIASGYIVAKVVHNKLNGPSA